MKVRVMCFCLHDVHIGSHGVHIGSHRVHTGSHRVHIGSVDICQFVV